MPTEMVVAVGYIAHTILLRRKMTEVAKIWREQTPYLSEEVQDIILIEWQNRKLDLLIPDNDRRRLNNEYGC